MELTLFKRRSEHEWEIPAHGAMRVPAVIYASEPLIRAMYNKVYEQAVNVAKLPGHANSDCNGPGVQPVGHTRD